MKVVVGRKRSAGKRVLMLLENNPYPQDARVRREATTLVEAGYQVSVVCPAAGGQRRTETFEGVRVYRYPTSTVGSGPVEYLWEYGYSLVVMTLMSAYIAVVRGFDVVHAHNPPDFLVLLGGLYKVFGKKFVFDHHDLSPEMYLARFRKPPDSTDILHRVLQVFEKATFRTADHVISTNESYRTIALQRGGVSEDSVTVVRNGPDLDRVRLVEPDAELQRRAKSILGYVGVMGFQDGIDYFLRALHHLKEDLGRSDFYAVLIGTGDAVPELEALSSELGLEDHVWFTGRVSDEALMRYLSTTDICVDPDPWNPFNDRSTMIKMTEYMALEKPIVAFDLTEHRVTAGDAAIYAKPNSEMDFAEKLAKLMDDPGQRSRMGAIGRERIETKLSWATQQPNLLAAYSSLLESEQLASAKDEDLEHG